MPRWEWSAEGGRRRSRSAVRRCDAMHGGCVSGGCKRSTHQRVNREHIDRMPSHLLRHRAPASASAPAHDASCIRCPRRAWYRHWIALRLLQFASAGHTVRICARRSLGDREWLSSAETQWPARG